MVEGTVVVDAEGFGFECFVEGGVPGAEIGDAEVGADV